VRCAAASYPRKLRHSWHDRHSDTRRRVPRPPAAPKLQELDVPVEPSDMSFTVSLASRSFEWGSTSLSALFATRSNIVNPSFRSMMADMLRFNK